AERRPRAPHRSRSFSAAAGRSAGRLASDHQLHREGALHAVAAVGDRDRALLPDHRRGDLPCRPL
ncbi:MAG: Transcriptional regulator, Xre family, partial [uncultured Solirubrobacteraceae bacterium]